MPRGPEIWILLIVLLVLFGAKRLPGAARSLGQSMRILKAETKGLHDDDATVVGSTGTLPAGPATGAGGVLPVTPMPPTGEDQQAPPHP